MTWDAYHRRKTVLREMLVVADRQRDITLTELLDTIDGAHEAFATQADVLFDLQMTWFQRLSGHMDRLLSDIEQQSGLVPVTAWAAAAADLPGARRLLDAHRDEPVMRTAVGKELSYLALSAGVAGIGPELVSHGLRIQESARAEVAARPVAPMPDTVRPSLMARLRSAIAA